MRGSRRGSALRTGTSALIRYKRNELEHPKDIIKSKGKAQQNNRMVYRVFCVDRVSRSQLVKVGVRYPVLRGGG